MDFFKKFYRHLRFECPFCGNTAPIEEEGHEDALIEITHIQYKRENDFISVEHLNKSELVPPYKRKNLFHENVVSINVLFGSYDGVDHFSKNLKISVACPSCGAEVIGKEHQNTFECEHCGHKIIVADSIKAGTYKKRNIVGQFGENILRWFAPELIDYRICKAHETITGNRVELMSTAKRHFDGQKNGLILIPVYNTELLQVENQYISVAVNGQTGKVVVQIQESEKGIIDTRNLSEPMEYESEPRHWDDNPREYTRFEGPYRVEKTKDKDMVKIVKSSVVEV